MLIRDFPYPFSSALTIVSDVDASTRGRFRGYVEDIVGKRGLDFGDSVWLKTSHEGPAAEVPYSSGLGIFSRHFGIGSNDDPRSFHWIRTFLESIAEYHTGNLDHFHSFMMRGPRVAVLESAERTSNTLTFELGQPEAEGFWRCKGIFIDAVCVVARSTFTINRVSLTERDGRITVFDSHVDSFVGDDGSHRVVFVAEGCAEDDTSIPRLDNIASVAIECASPADAQATECVLLTSGSRQVILDRLRFLRGRFNVETSLVTEHAGYHFRSEVMSTRRDASQNEYVSTHKGVLAALNGTGRTEQNAVGFSTDADDPRSVARVLPEISSELEVRFLIPEAATSSTGWSIEKMVEPLPTREGTIVYQAQRMLPNLKEPVGKARFDGTHSHQDNFMPRLGKVLDGVQATPGLFWPIYTHLGAITIPTADHALPTPYFEGDDLDRLQNCVYNVSGSVEPEARVWMARSSTFYDYALMRRSIANHVTECDANTIEITSWHDEVLNKTLPRSTSQLYGLTFYVDDPARVKVLLDGHPIGQLARNAKDETGRPSVTICEAEIRHVVFDALDPMQKAGLEAELTGGTWRFHRAEKGKSAYGRLTVSRGQAASLRIPMHGWRAVGSQLLSMIGQRSKSGALGVTLETADGGRFFFGDRTLLDLVGPVAAHYVFEHERGPGSHNFVAPFHCLSWSEESSPGGPMPSHMLASITLHCAGGRGAYVDFGKLALARPRTTTLNHGETTSYCLGGLVPEFKPQQVVWAQAKGKSGVISATADQRGWFCFTNLPEGIYNVWTDGENGKIYDRRGALIDLRSDMMTLELSRKSAEKANA